MQGAFNETTFNASLVSEMRAIAFVQRLVREGRLSEGEYKDLRLAENSLH